ncbi:MAG: hypothetical protein JNL01_06660 [Bdellovibrionales bacterium]|nr:hypothetical protein [Bdellovibrionales bacterium]
MNSLFRLTKRDLLFLETLGSYGVLSSAQIHKLFFGAIKRTVVLKRLRVLEERKWIRRVGFLDFGLAAWGITQKSKQELQIPFSYGRANQNTLSHDITVSELRSKLESTGVVSGFKASFHFRHQLTPQDKRLGIFSSDFLMPDGEFKLSALSGEKLVALELELTLKAKRRYFELWSKYIRDKESLWRVWYVVPTKRMGEKLLSFEAEWRSAGHDSKKPLLLWSAMEEVLVKPLTTHLHHSSGTTSISALSLKKTTQPPAQALSRSTEKPLPLNSNQVSEPIQKN